MQLDKETSRKMEIINAATIFLVCLTLFPIAIIINFFGNADSEGLTLAQAERFMETIWQLSVMLGLTTITYAVGRIVRMMEINEQK